MLHSLIKSGARKLACSIAIAGVLAVSLGCGGMSSGEPTTSAAQTPPAPANPTSTPVVDEIDGGYRVEIHLTAPTGSFQVGYAIIESVPDGTSVTVDVEPPAEAAQPMHIHIGDCTNVGDIVYPLANVVLGHSVTIIPEPIDQVVTSGRLINVHRSFQDFPTYTACGELPGLP